MAVVATGVTDKVAELRRDDSRLTASEIARRVGVSREWVRQVLVKLGLPTKVRSPLVPRICHACGIKIAKRNITGLCSKCLRESHYVTLVCDECVRQYKIPRSLFRTRQGLGYKHTFCGRKCMGKFCRLLDEKKQPKRGRKEG